VPGLTSIWTGAGTIVTFFICENVLAQTNKKARNNNFFIFFD